jgi:maltose phosphorylase
VAVTGKTISRDKYIARKQTFTVCQGQTYRIDKLVAVCSSRDKNQKKPAGVRATMIASGILERGFDEIHQAHIAAWAGIWRDNDIEVTGDVSAQQGIRFCVFQMHQSYAGNDPLVNIAAKGLSGHGYGGLYWWDTEAYMVPFFLYTAPEKARTLLLYRFFTLAGARHKASLHSYDGAMFPWVTIDGEERSYDWNYGALEQHVGSAVTHAIRQYVSATGDNDFLFDYGAEVVLETSRLGYEPA